MRKLATTDVRINKAPTVQDELEHQTLSAWIRHCSMVLAKPLRIGVRAIKLVTGLVEFELTSLCGL